MGKVIPVLIIPVLNRYDLLDKAIESIDFPIDNILIINNGREVFSPKRSDINIRVLDMPSNFGVAGSWNLGIKCYPHVPFWTFSSADIRFGKGSLAELARNSSPGNFVKSNASYSCFSLGEEIVSKVGLFDEYIYPAYYEDNDYEDRMIMHGFKNYIIMPGIDVEELEGPSQTIKSDPALMENNHRTFVANGEYYRQKKVFGDYTVKGWDLKRRRQNEWLH